MFNYYINDKTLDVMCVSGDDNPIPLNANYRLMTDDGIDKHKNPMKYWSSEQLAEHNRSQMPNLTPIELDIKLNDNGLYDVVQNLIKDNFNLRIAYTRATFFSRTDPFIDQARIALNLTDEQVDEMWIN